MKTDTFFIWVSLVAALFLWMGSEIGRSQPQPPNPITQEQAMDILKTGYYMGGIRQRQKEDLDLYWRSDSLYFVKTFFKTVK